MTAVPAPPPLRTHQAQALRALDEAWKAGRTRAWVALPPGAGKTRVGLETASAHLGSGAVSRVVVLGPNTAIQGQWVAQARAQGLRVGTDRALVDDVTVLTYQSLAVFDADDEVTDDGDEVVGDDATLMDRLHENGRALVDAMAALPADAPVLLVLDECHHLLEVWGRLLAEVLDHISGAHVLGLTATPPAALTAVQAELVDELFGAPLFSASIPAVVREGDLAPFVELAWLVTPTPTEAEWLTSSAARFTELVTQVMDPAFGSSGFLAWLDQRFASGTLTWVSMVRATPDLCRAALRAHHAGLLALPPGARLTEEHRSPMSADDWVMLLEDWLGHLSRTGDEDDAGVVAAVKAALPSVGYQWTRRGIRKGRTIVDRVLTRSEAKTHAAAAIIDHESSNLGDRMRMLVLCDHERAGATLPADLVGVLDQQSGSAHAVLTALLADPRCAALRPLLVTGSTVAAAPETLRALLDHLRSGAHLAGDVVDRLVVVLDVSSGVARLEGPWTSRTWVRCVTSFFTVGGTQVLVGTRGLLGEGWDAPAVTGLVDLTAVTTTTAVTQTRGRALRIDPAWPEKVAVNWTVVCVAPEHPKGSNDWDRLVRKHDGYFGVDESGEVTDGVAHIDSHFSPYAPPPADQFDAINARMLVRSSDRPEIASRWDVGAPYTDIAVPAVRVRRRPPVFESKAGTGLGTATTPALAVLTPAGLERRSTSGGLERRDRAAAYGGAAGVAVGALALGVLVGGWALVLLLLLAVLLPIVTHRQVVRRVLADGARIRDAVSAAPSLTQVAGAVADALHACGLTAAGASHVEVHLDAEGEYRCVLTGVPPDQAHLFATAVDDALSPMGTPRYVIARWVLDPSPSPSRKEQLRRARAAVDGTLRPNGVVWHQVPSVLGANAARSAAYGTAWRHWVGGGEPVYTGSPEGHGILAANAGADPFDVTTVMRLHWS